MLVAELDGVAGVVAALVAGHEVEGRGDQVDDLPLPFVAPLAADDGDGGAFDAFHRSSLPERECENARAWPTTSLLTGDALTLDDLVEVARRGREGDARAGSPGAGSTRPAPSSTGRCAENRVVYGVTTGFGKFADVVIPREKLATLQLNLVREPRGGRRGASPGGGRPCPDAPPGELSRERLLRACGRETLETLLALLNAGIHPVVPSQGSVGASGDLAPLAHLALAVIGEGEVFVGGKRRPAAGALRAAGIAPVTLRGEGRAGPDQRDADDDRRRRPRADAAGARS